MSDVLRNDERRLSRRRVRRSFVPITRRFCSNAPYLCISQLHRGNLTYIAGWGGGNRVVTQNLLISVHWVSHVKVETQRTDM